MQQRETPPVKSEIHKLSNIQYLHLFHTTVVTGIGCGLETPEEWLTNMMMHYDCFFAFEKKDETDSFPHVSCMNEFEERFLEEFKPYQGEEEEEENDE